MGEIIKIDDAEIEKNVHTENDLIEITNGILFDARADLKGKEMVSMPIAGLAGLGAGIASLLPAMRTVTQSATFNTDGLFRLADAKVGDALKAASDGNFWGAKTTAEGASKLAKFQSVDEVTATTTDVMSINPATMMMAVALFSIEQQLDNIAEMEKQILSFLENEKEAEIEADVEMLVDLIKKYKLNWNNEHFVASNHKIVLDIQRTARKHMNSYRKNVADILDARQFINSQGKVSARLRDVQRKFKYYRLSLYTFSLASLLEIMLSGNFSEEYISGIEKEIRSLSDVYRDLFSQCSVYLERMSDSAIDTNAVKGIGNAGKAIGKFIGSVPVINKGPVDEFLQDKGEKLNDNAAVTEKKSVREFASVSNPGTSIFTEQMDKMIQICNHTSQIYFDKDRIYLTA